MTGEKCPSCGAEKLRLSARLDRHYLRAAFGSRKRFCVSCHARWTAAKKEGWPLLTRGALLLAVVVVGRAAQQYHRPQPLKHAPIYVKPSKAPVGPDGEPGAETSPDGDAVLPLAEGATGGTTAAWLRAHQNDTAGGTEGPRRNIPQARLGLGDTFALLSRMLKQSLGFRGGVSQGQIDSMLKQDKKQLWAQYGKYFGSKEEAKAAYEQAKKESEKAHGTAKP